MNKILSLTINIAVKSEVVAVKDLEKVMDFLNEDFEKTKDLLIKLSTHLDITKDSYNKLYEEYKKRNYGSI
jgi:protein required for attachment to host cells